MAAVLGILVCAGCSTVQKGATIGGGLGGATGAMLGHASSLGSANGAMLGVPVGAAAGALAGDLMYDDDTGEGLAERDATIRELNERLGASAAQLKDAQDMLSQEQARSQALLEDSERRRNEVASAAPTLSAESQPADFGPGTVAVEQRDGSIKVTILSEVLFASGKANLTSEGKAVLARAARTIQSSYPEATVEVRGHTDNVPIRYSNYKSNWELSVARSLSVLHHLIESGGVAPERMMASGLADTQPVASNDAPDGRRKNRRAEIVIRPNGIMTARAQ